MDIKRFSLRVREELLKDAERDASQQEPEGISVNQYIVQAIEEKLKSKTKGRDVPTLRPILTKYPAKCSDPNCGVNIPVGSPALWGKGGIILCMDCQIKNLGDKTLSSKYVLMRKLSKTVKSLREQANKYADFILDVKDQKRMVELSRQIEYFLALNEDYLRVVGTPEERKLLTQLTAFLKDLMKEWAEFRDYMTAKMAPLRRKVKKVAGQI